MKIYPNVTQQGLIILSKIAKQQKNQRAIKLKNRILKQTHDLKLAENLSHITKKLEEANESTTELGEVSEKTISEIENNQEIIPVEINSDNEDDSNANKNTLPNSSNFSLPMMETLVYLMKTRTL